MKPAHFLFYVSTASTFGGLWTMHMHLAPRDLFSWCLVLFSFTCMAWCGLWSMQLPTEARK